MSTIVFIEYSVHTLVFSSIVFTLYWRTFHVATKSYPIQYEQQRPGAAQVVHTHRIPCRGGWPRRFDALNSKSFLLNIYFRLSGFQASLPFMYFCHGPNRCSHCNKQSQEIGAAQLRFVTEIAPKSRFLCVNRSRYRVWFSYRRKSYPV